MKILNIRYLISLLFFLCISFLILEVAFRFYISHINKNAHEQDLSKIFINTPDKKYLFEHKKSININVINNKFKSNIITNNLGLREVKNYNHIKSSVAFLGDSGVEGLSVSNHELLDSIFEEKTGMVSLNFGVGAYNSYQSFEYFKEKYNNNFNVKMIIFIFCLNDLQQNGFLRTFDKENNGFKLLTNTNIGIIKNNNDNNFIVNIKHFLKKSYIVSLLDSYKDRFISNNSKKNEFSVKEDYLYKHTKPIFKKTKLWAKDRNIELLFVITPTLHQVNNIDSLESTKQTKKVLNELDINYFDLFKIIQTHSSNKKLFEDNLHFNKEGHHMIGLEIANFVKKNYPNIN